MAEFDIIWATRAKGPAMDKRYVRWRMVWRVAKIVNTSLKNGWSIRLEGEYDGAETTRHVGD